MIHRRSTQPASSGPLQAFQQAVTLHGQGRLWEASQLYELVAKSNDRHFDSVYRLGLIRLQQGRFADAMHLFRRAVRIDKNSADAQFHLAVALTGLERIEDAIPRFEKALALRPVFAEAHNNLGHALQLLNRHEEAAVQYEKALAIQPAYAEAHNNLANTLHMLGRSEAAILHYRKALAIRPGYAEAHNNLGNLLASLGDHDEAIVSYSKALALKPKYLGAHHSLGNSLGALGRYEEALSHYESAFLIKPDDADVHVSRGKALDALDRHDEALAEYDAALAVKPDHIGALTARGNELIGRGQHAEATEVLERLVKCGCHTVNVLLALAGMPQSVIGIDVLGELDKLVKPEGQEQAEFDNLRAFARAATLDKAGRHVEAWETLVTANRVVLFTNREEIGKTLARQRATLRRLRQKSGKMAICSREDGQPALLFILGPSRCGKTTVERLMSTLDGVKRGYEDPLVQNAVTQAFRRANLPASPIFEHLPQTLHPLCRDLYIAELVERSPLARIYTSTNPGRIHDADLVASVLPNVRFLLVKRELEDNLLRIFQRKYKPAKHLYSYDLRAARDHIHWYHEMMDLLAEALPELVRVIHYEDMVQDPAAALRVAAELCGTCVPDCALPEIGDDRGCAAPYRQFMAAELEG